MVHDNPDAWVARMISLLTKNWHDLSFSMGIKKFMQEEGVFESTKQATYFH